MSTVYVKLSEDTWQDLVSLGHEEKVSPDDLLEKAVRRFLQEKSALLQQRMGLQQSFGVWEERADLKADSTVVVDELRRGWDEREQKLGPA